MLKQRWSDSGGKNDYVFPSWIVKRRTTHHIGWTHNILQVIAAKVGTKADSPHDLRRSFTWIAEDVLGKDSYRLKLLLNHALPSGDVTSGYLNITTEKLRTSVVAIETRILQLAGKKPSAEVLQLKAASA
jgi:integrase